MFNWQTFLQLKGQCNIYVFFFTGRRREQKKRKLQVFSPFDSDAELQSWRGLLNKMLIVLTTKGFPSNPTSSWDDRTRCLPDSCRRIAICLYAVSVSPWCRVMVSAACHVVRGQPSRCCILLRYAVLVKVSWSPTLVSCRFARRSRKTVVKFKSIYGVATN